MAGLMDLFTGDFLTGGDDRNAKGYLDDAMSYWDNLEKPKLSPIELERYGYAGDVDQELLSAGSDVNYLPIEARLGMLSETGPSAMEGVSTDPRLKDQQMASLSALDDIAQSGGMTGADTAALSRIQSQTGQADRGRRGAIQQNMASRGMGGSGMELLAQLQSSQAATDQQAQEGLDVAGMAQRRSLDAMMQSGQLAGGIRDQDWSQKAQQAQARDAISRFNTQNRNQMSQHNAGQQNQMGQFNTGNRLKTDMYNRDTRLDTDRFNAESKMRLGMSNRDARQGTMDRNTGSTNEQSMYNAGLGQQDFENSYKIAGGKSGAAGMGMNYWQGQGDKKRDAWGNIVSGGMMIGAGAAGRK